MLNQKYIAIPTLSVAILATILVCPCAWGQTFNVLHSFGNTGDGAPAQYGQVFDGQGNLYGVTDYGPVGDGCLGNGGCGTVYQLKPNGNGTWTESLIHIFSDSGGTYPSSSLILDPQGNLYGSASGQSHYPDVVYQLAPNSNGTWTESALYQFPPVPGTGNIPGELTFDASGNIFGTTRFGGANETGTVFSLNRSSGWQQSLLFTFDGFPNNHSGGGAYGAITFDSSGNLYGTTLGGGAHSSGVVYQLTNQQGTWQQTVLYNFAGGLDGNAPLGVIFGPDGNLYGTTQVGGNLGSIFCFLGCGTVFKLTPNGDGTWTKTTLYAFRGGPHDAATPTTPLAIDGAGNLYGTTAEGGLYNSGIAYEITP